MRYAVFAILALVLALPEAAQAQGPGSFARRTGTYGGSIRLDANYYAPDACQAALSAHRAAPPGQSVPAFVVPVTIVIGPNPRGCGTSRVVRRVVNVGAGASVQLIQIFFVNEAGRILKVERVSIQSQ